MFIKKYLKWISTALVLTGILLTNLNIYPINIYFQIEVSLSDEKRFAIANVVVSEI